MSIKNLSNVTYDKDYILKESDNFKRTIDSKSCIESDSKFIELCNNKLKPYITEKLIYGFSLSSCVELDVFSCEEVNKFTENMWTADAIRTQRDIADYVEHDLRRSGFYVMYNLSDEKECDLFVCSNLFSFLKTYFRYGGSVASFTLFSITLFTVLLLSMFYVFYF